MAIGKGVYDDLCTNLREQSKAESAVVIVRGGVFGGGFSCQGSAEFTLSLPETLESMASQIRADLKGAEAPHIICPQCQRVSFSKGDIDHKYCAKCGTHPIEVSANPCTLQKYVITDCELGNSNSFISAVGVVEAMESYLPWPSLDLSIKKNVGESAYQVVDNQTDFMYFVSEVR